MGFERLLTAEMVTAFAVFLGALFGGVVAVISELRKPSRPVDDDTPDPGEANPDRIVQAIITSVQEETDHINRTLWVIERKIGEQLHRLEKLALSGESRVRHVLERDMAAIDMAEHDRLLHERSDRGRADRDRSERDRPDRDRPDRDRPERERPERDRTERDRAERERIERDRPDRDWTDRDRPDRDRPLRETALRAGRDRPDPEPDDADRGDCRGDGRGEDAAATGRDRDPAGVEKPERTVADRSTADRGPPEGAA